MNKNRFISALISIAVLALVLFSNTACSNGEASPEPDAPVTTAVSMIAQGNPTTINLADIVEKDMNAWVKISTQFDPELSMYSYDTLAADTCAIAVDLTVSNFDCGESTLYWCYQLKSGENTVAVWDNTSPTDTLTITEDGRYMLVFDVQAALGGTLDTIESLQVVFPCASETTSTVLTVNSVKCVTNADELEYFVTGPISE